MSKEQRPRGEQPSGQGHGRGVPFARTAGGTADAERERELESHTPAFPAAWDPKIAEALVLWLKANGPAEVSRIAHALPLRLRVEVDPEDVLQEALVRALEQLVRMAKVGNAGVLRDPDDLFRWLRVLVRRTLVDRLPSGSRRKRDRRWLTSLEGFASPGAREPMEHGVESRAPSAHAYLVALETAARLDDALRLLPQRQRLAFVLVGVKGVSYAEAARALCCDIATVRDRVRRARSSLAARLVKGKKRRPQTPVE